jgi:hypothetical protein
MAVLVSEKKREEERRKEGRKAAVVKKSVALKKAIALRAVCHFREGAVSSIEKPFLLPFLVGTALAGGR